MKKLFCLSAALSIGAVFVMANPVVTGNDHGVKRKKESRWEPNRATEFQFSKDFPNAKNVSWNFGKFVEATFLDNVVSKTAYYDEDGNLVGTTNEVDVTALPEKPGIILIKNIPVIRLRK